MAFDIYGNDLRRGFCEVHPHVGEEYPCSLCYMETEKRNQQNRSEKEEYNRIQKQEYEESLRYESDGLYDIDFCGNVLAQMEIKNGQFKFVQAMNGYGHSIKTENITITKTN